MEGPLAMPNLVFVLINVQVLNGDILHGVGGIAPNDTGGNQGMKDVDVTECNVLK
jgi:hypothetical protein